MDERKTIQSIDRAVEILRCFCESNVLGIAELSRVTRMHKSTVSNIVLTLEANGLLVQNESTRKYELGAELCHLAASVNTDIRSRANPYLYSIRDLCGETVSLGVCQGMQAVYLDSVQSLHPICSSTIPGTGYPIFAAAFGRTIMAFLPVHECEQLLKKVEFRQYTDSTLCSMGDLRAALDQIRAQGYAINQEETEVGHTCIAAPVLNSANYPVASICVSGPSMRINGVRTQYIIDILLAKTRELSCSLGCRRWEMTDVLGG